MLFPVDLHTHTCHSDGRLTPSQLVLLAAAQGLKALAIADHDSTGGIDEAMACGNLNGIEVIAAVELSVETRGHSDVHLLGYFINHHDSCFQDKLEAFRVRRDSRGREIIVRINEKLAGEGKGRISYEEVLAESAGALGRPHVARVLVEKGFSKGMEDAFDRYLVPCNVPKEYFPVDEAINEIHRIGGLALLAHPTSISRDYEVLRGVIAEMVRLGLDGIEVYNTMATLTDAEFLLGLAMRHRLAVSGGSDFHGNNGEELLAIEGGRFSLDYRLVDGLKERLRQRHDRVEAGEEKGA
jgi:predicted metal-dependent phosphoesterase TrpH